MSNRIEVLDHGFVRLVSYMQPTPEILCGGFEGDYKVQQEGWTGDLEIVRNARVSYDADWRTGTDEGSDDRLVRRLHARGHTSPFEAMVFTFEVQAPIFVFRQWHRHRTWSYNELSARYSPMKELFYVPKPEHIGYQPTKEKQGKEGVHEYAHRIADEIYKESVGAHETYRQLLATGMTREQARLAIPVNTYSRMFATVDLHNLFHFLTLRLDSHAQYEIRVYAEALLTLIKGVVPIAAEAFETEQEKILIDEERKSLLLALEHEVEISEDVLDDDSDEDEEKYLTQLKSILRKMKP